ncbi:MAG TPA: hypothetical protein PLM14_09275 [Candidatus Hydrogenedentes bacterium]|nr:hypothetical protein [Candidatus Hydrogenedentota bacterium]
MLATITSNGTIRLKTTTTAHPLPLFNIRFIFSCRPLFVSGTPVARDNCDFIRLMPVARFQENRLLTIVPLLSSQFGDPF